MDTATDLNRTAAEAVRAALDAAGMSRRDASERTGIPLTTLQRSLSGHRPFRLDEIGLLADVTGTTPVALVGGVAA